ncbi:anchored repeat ABC transporter, substrate-binding protein [Amycolatopsis sp. PS_44_ISF1]|uniref:anchored repeat ABC transporter, substrate-binding protein n=1 Tax=Amycolatopsis sp. PS_44_ISF1 TaxID=2974917 RepID=UPI0028DDF6A3|nr:anchored repeat ABC transporter, substrate-binding protein [Amycolatopsis sp. PS_44_ISF1]MDT8914953.1 anchored repeat ABC transporter, substrate-binding protein [Amycolatopsis sp. PS_44_ISF1]
MRERAVARALGACVAMVLVVSGCAPVARSGGGIRVVTTTGILADLVQAVGGDRVRVGSIVPAGGDPHSYEPTPADAKRVAQADVTFTNHLLLEEQRLIKAVDANAREGTPNVSLAEDSESYGAHVIPLVENVGLDVLWLGLRVRGEGARFGATRTSEIRLFATALEGPGSLTAYLTESLGQPDVYFSSADGFDGRDSTTLPPAAHTHLNWAFSAPGLYQLTLRAQLDEPAGAPKPLGQATFTFAVGVDPQTAAPGRRVLDRGHTDLTVDLDQGRLYTFNDATGGTTQEEIAAPDAVIEVPNKAIDQVPGDPRYAFLGAPGARIFQLPQAVLGKHVHGEIDPHLWQDAQNVAAYAQLIRDTLKKVDPAGAEVYDRNTAGYRRQLDDLDGYLTRTIATIPPGNRQLVTTHDAFGYLADAYGLKIAGFVVPNPAQEPSVADVRKLTETIRNLHVPAVFTEPNLAQRASTLIQVAHDLGAQVCSLYGDAFDANTRTYLAMMRHNADELARCLGGTR